MRDVAVGLRAVMTFRHSTWDEALAYAHTKAKTTGYRYSVRRSPVGWWLVSRIPGSEGAALDDH